jgi:hypothetical protein
VLTCSRTFSPGCHIAGFQPSDKHRIVVELDALLPAVLDRAFKEELR